MRVEVHHGKVGNACVENVPLQITKIESASTGRDETLIITVAWIRTDSMLPLRVLFLAVVVCVHVCVQHIFLTSENYLMVRIA